MSCTRSTAAPEHVAQGTSTSMVKGWGHGHLLEVRGAGAYALSYTPFQLAVSQGTLLSDIYSLSHLIPDTTECEIKNNLGQVLSK